jgi:hypothetical protein
VGSRSGHQRHDPRFRETLFGSGAGILAFYLDEDARPIRIFDIVWMG